MSNQTKKWFEHVPAELIRLAGAFVIGIVSAAWTASAHQAGLEEKVDTLNQRIERVEHGVDNIYTLMVKTK